MCPVLLADCPSIADGCLVPQACSVPKSGSGLPSWEKLRDAGPSVSQPGRIVLLVREFAWTYPFIHSDVCFVLVLIQCWPCLVFSNCVAESVCMRTRASRRISLCPKHSLASHDALRSNQDFIGATNTAFSSSSSVSSRRCHCWPRTRIQRRWPSGFLPTKRCQRRRPVPTILSARGQDTCVAEALISRCCSRRSSWACLCSLSCCCFCFRVWCSWPVGIPESNQGVSVL
jgi:hypothetical protein